MERDIASDRPGVVQQTAQFIAPRDRVRWGPIWAGLLTALGTFLILSVLAVAIGAQAVQAGAADQQTAGQAGGIVSAVLALVSFLLGGFIAGRTSAVTGRGYGFLNGFLVWTLGIVLILALTAFGLGQLFGAAGDLFGQYRQLGSPTPEGVDPNQLAEGIRNSSFIGFLALILPAVAAGLGGMLGARSGDDADWQRTG